MKFAYHQVPAKVGAISQPHWSVKKSVKSDNLLKLNPPNLFMRIGLTQF